MKMRLNLSTRSAASPPLRPAPKAVLKRQTQCSARLQSGLVALLLALSGVARAAGDEPPRVPRITPDYTGVQIPPNIAPLNFRIMDPGERYQVLISAPAGKPISISSAKGLIRIPLPAWRTLLSANRGENLLFEIRVRDRSGAWHQFQTVTNSISRDEIDGYLAYRLLHPLFSRYGTGNLGIFQRNLQNFDQDPILQVVERTQENSWCKNCHTFLNRQPDTFTLHLRSRSEKSMLLVKEGKERKLDLPGGYMSWHPSGRWIVFSQNKLSLFFHSVGETRDVYDAISDLALYDLEANRVTSPEPIAQPTRLENWPMWSQDGKTLFFSSTAATPFEQYKSVRYDLMRVPFDAARGEWGAAETLLSAAEIGQSLVQPRPSPDGRFLVFTACQYGHFPIYQSNSALHILELETGRHWPMELNSGRGETWHCWSSNGRWLVFSSKRLGRLLARPFFSHIDEHGRASKPFVLPQDDPRFYDTFIKTYNVPEFITGPVTVPQRELLQTLASPPTIKPQQAPPSFTQTGESGESGE